MNIETSIIFFITILIFAITPGPGVFALLAKALSEGIQPCISLSFGMAISDIVYLILACYGLSALAEQWGGVFTTIRIVGAIYLIYLGWKIWNSRSQYREVSEPDSGQRKLAGFAQGFLISASNPKVILFYLAFLPNFMDLSTLSVNDVMLASLLTFIALMLGLMSIPLSTLWAKQFFRSEKSMRSLNRVAGSIMISAGLYLGLRQ
ncbi:MAG: threonine/homoserine/homoserine lactone efflux protein [Polaribacter sp.]|jgi:threonine/homoserine/homoserine lactone efflux protein